MCISWKIKCCASLFKTAPSQLVVYHNIIIAEQQCRLRLKTKHDRVTLQLLAHQLLIRRNTAGNRQYFCICYIIAEEGCRNNKIKHKSQRNKVHKFDGRMLFWSASFSYVMAKCEKYLSLFLDCNLQKRCVVTRISQFSVGCYGHCRSRHYMNTQDEVVLLSVYDFSSILLHVSL